MGWLILLVLVVGAVALYVPSSSRKPESRRPAPTQLAGPTRPSPRPSLAAEEARIRREIEAEAARMMPQIKAEAVRKRTEIEAREARIQAEVMRAAAGAFEEPLRFAGREDYVPKEDEGRYLTRTADGLPNFYLADADDRLMVWSWVDGGGLINPKGPGLRHLGLYASYARGAEHYRSAYRSADLSKGKWIDLVREPKNPHDKNAVAMCAPGSRAAFAYVQRGRAPAVARRMDAGEELTAVSMRGPGKGRDDDSTFVLIGSRADLTAMLDTRGPRPHHPRARLGPS